MLLGNLLDGVPFADDDLTRMVYPKFRVRVVVIKKRPPRHPAFEFFLDLGKNLLDSIMNGTPLPRATADLVFVFPERWLSTPETQQFMGKVNDHPQAGELFKTVTLVTSNPVILTDFFAHNMKTVEFPDDPV